MNTPSDTSGTGRAPVPMFAHYYNCSLRERAQLGGKRRGTLVITRPDLYTQNRLCEYPVRGKIEARALAIERGAKPWNF